MPIPVLSRPAVLMLVGLSLTLPAVAQTTSADGPAADSAAGVGITKDADFLRLATSANILEIRSSEMARDRAASDAVKAFAEQMIADHTAAMQGMAEASGTALPDLSTDLSAMLDPQHATLLQQLDATQGDGFDVAYVTLQNQAHDQAVALFQTYATNGEEGPVKAFAEATLPKLQHHLEMAQSLAQR